MRRIGPVSARGLGRYLALSAGITLVYYLLGRLGLLMVLPPYQVAPLYPAAGWGLAVLLIWGLRYLPAVALGSFIVQATTMAGMGDDVLLLSAGIGCGAAAQAAAGRLLMRRWCGRPLVLASPREIAGYLAAAALAGLISPSCATLLLKAAGIIATAQMGLVWTVWWTGDLMGVLIATPITLALIGRPRSAWGVRRFSVGMPMLLTSMLVGLGRGGDDGMGPPAQPRRLHARRDQRGPAAGRPAARTPVGAGRRARPREVQAHNRHARSSRVPPELLTEDSPLIALGLTLRVARADVERFNAAAAADAFPGGYRARDRRRAGDLAPSADEDMMAIRLIEPLSRNAGALGVNVRTIPSARAAIEKAAPLGRPVASAASICRRTREVAVGIVIYQPLYRARPRRASRRWTASSSPRCGPTCCCRDWPRPGPSIWAPALLTWIRAHPSRAWAAAWVAKRCSAAATRPCPWSRCRWTWRPSVGGARLRSARPAAAARPRLGVRAGGPARHGHGGRTAAG